jgi:ABC-type Fe3+/spermidine/putrescine transport system ATPase subunit
VRVDLQDVAFAYGRQQEAVAAVSLALADGEITVVVGPSGSGKSTLVALIAGLLAPAAGRILFAGRDMAGVPPERRDVGVVFQSYALFPHLSVEDNVAFGLTTRHRRLPRREVAPRVRELAALLGLTPLLGRRPAELSGGERQRVALARALAPRPALLLLDEPLSALDASLRRQLRAEVAALLRGLGTTVLYVTHDQEEAMMLADHLVVLQGGRVVQAGPPLELYRRPANPFVAGFLGEANLLPIAASQAESEPLPLPTLLPTLPLLPPLPPRGPGGSTWRPGDAEAAPAAPAASATAGGWLLVRPEDVVADERGVPAAVLETRCLGALDRVVLRLAGGRELRAHLPAGTGPPPGSTLRIAARRGHLLAAATDVGDREVQERVSQELETHELDHRA